MEVWAVLLLLLQLASAQRSGLSSGFYRRSCPVAETIVRETVRDAQQSDPTIAAGLLRMNFHDCFVEGCDASILIDSVDGNEAEKDAPINRSLHGFELIDAAKSALETVCPGVVSCADILALATRDAVFLAGGPHWVVRSGRRDGRSSSSSQPGNGQLPGPFSDVPELTSIFGAKGLSQREMVVLSGAHTVGGAHCATFSNRIFNFSSTSSTDPSMDPDLAQQLIAQCPSSDDASLLVNLDSSSTQFDNSYFSKLEMSQGLLTSDQALFSHPHTSLLVSSFSRLQPLFFHEFSRAITKMGEIGVKVGDAGEVRASCRTVNPM